MPRQTNTERSPPLAGPREKNRQRTLAALQQALKFMQENGEKVTLKAVAEQAGVSPSLLNHRYQDFAEEVRSAIGRTIRQQRSDIATQLAAERERNRQLRATVEDQLMEIRALTSKNEALRMELALQHAIAEGRVKPFRAPVKPLKS
jgi:AcrR family transcriptional regulator